jgi:hypothetical protein
MRLPSKHPFEYLSTDDRIIEATLLVAVVGTAGRLADPSLNTVLLAGCLAGLLNGPRTDEWEFGLQFAGLPAILAATLITGVLLIGIPVGFYAFPVDTWASWDGLFDVLGPLIEIHLLVPLYFLEAILTFHVVKRLQAVVPVGTN